MEIAGRNEGTERNQDLERDELSQRSRTLSLLGGGLALLAACRLARLPLALAGGYLLYRGISGRCLLQAMASRRPATTRRSVTIARPPADLYQFCRRLENLARLVPGIECIESRGNQRYHGEARTMGLALGWQVDVVEDIPGQRIHWAPVPGSAVDVGGRIEFHPANERGTLVTATLTYQFPAASLGGGLARLIGQGPESRLTEGLRRLKQLMEAGEMPTVRRQPAGDRSLLGRLSGTVMGVPAGGRP